MTRSLRTAYGRSDRASVVLAALCVALLACETEGSGDGAAGAAGAAAPAVGQAGTAESLGPAAGTGQAAGVGASAGAMAAGTGAAAGVGGMAGATAAGTGSAAGVGGMAGATAAGTGSAAGVGGTAGATGAGTGAAAGTGGEAPGAATFSAIFEEILTNGRAGNCMFAACHGGEPDPMLNGGLQIKYDDPAGAYNNLVNAASASTLCAGMTLVVPYDSQGSLLIQKFSDSPPCGMKMPIGNPLTEAQVQQIATWIDQGAQNN